MTKNFLLAGSEEMLSSAQRFQPETMHEFHTALTASPDALRNVAAAIRAQATRASEEYPLNPVVGEALDAAHHLQLRCADLLAEAAVTMSRAHMEDLARHDAPRQNERMWNVA